MENNKIIGEAEEAENKKGELFQSLDILEIGSVVSGEVEVWCTF